MTRGSDPDSLLEAFSRKINASQNLRSLEGGNKSRRKDALVPDPQEYDLSDPDGIEIQTRSANVEKETSTRRSSFQKGVRTLANLSEL